MRTEIDPYWLTLDIHGFDEEDPPGGDNNDDENDEDEEDEDEKPPSNSGDNADALKSALRKERKLRRDAEREAKRLKKDADSSQENLDAETARKEASTAKSTAEKLAGRLRDAAIDNAIIKAAGKFVDPDDAIRLIDRGEIDVDQDDDDPSEISVDAESVKEALEALAKKKPHLLKGSNTEEDEGGEGEPPKPSGSKFSGGKKPKKSDLDEAKLREMYPALGSS